MQYLETTVDKFIFRVATDRLYSCGRNMGSGDREPGRVRIGLSDYSSSAHGDVAFIHLKPLGTKLAAGDSLAELETSRPTRIFTRPYNGVLIEVNKSLDLTPETHQPRSLR